MKWSEGGKGGREGGREGGSKGREGRQVGRMEGGKKHKGSGKEGGKDWLRVGQRGRKGVRAPVTWGASTFDGVGVDGLRQGRIRKQVHVVWHMGQRLRR